MLVGKDHMLLGKDHACGEESCVGGKYFMVAKDHVGGGRCWLLQIHNFPTQNIAFCTKRVPMCPFAT